MKHFKSVIALTVICAVIAVLLAVTNSITAPIIEKNASAAANEALLVVYPDGGDFTQVDISTFELPATVTEVGLNAFLNCTSIIRLDWHPEKLSSGAAGSMESPAFKGCTSIAEVRIYEEVINIPSYLMYKSSKVAELKGVGTLKFMSGSQARSVGDYAFYQQKIGKVTFPATIVKIGMESFRNNNWLTIINFGTGTQNIGQFAFAYCNGLVTVTIPGNVQTVGAYAFRRCSKLETVVIEEGANYLSSYVFANCAALKEVRLPASLTKINGGLTYESSANIYYYEGTYADQYLHSKSARIVKETLVSLGEYVPA